MTSSLPYLSITEARAAFKSKSVSPLELTQAYLERIETLNAKLNAFLEIRAETALSEARAATEAMARGEDRGPLHGIPLALKDLFDVRGMHTTAGSPILKDNLAAEDAFVTRRLRAAGAVFLGKLNMHEWALGVTSINPHFGACHNPWNTDVITGGSSGGSAAALAAGLCVASLGSDTGGSIRIPSSLCGVVGLKPTYGRVSVRGVVPLSWSLDHVGPMARSVEDAAIMLQVIGGYDADDPYSVDQKLEIGDRRSEGTHLTVGVPDESFFADLHPDTEAAVRAAIETLGRLGFQQRDVSLPGFEIAEKASAKILLAEAAAYHEEDIETRSEAIGADVLTRFHWGQDITGPKYALARRTQVEWRRKMERLFESIDVLVLPATPLPATPIDSSDPLELSRGNLTRFTRMFNLTGNPSIVLPCGFTQDGLPIGLQIVGPHWREDKVLGLAYAYEQATGWHDRLPDIDS